MSCRLRFIQDVSPTLLFVVLLALPALIAACGKYDKENSQSHPGRAVFMKGKCALCHGEGAEGSTRAPRLSDLEEHFSRKQLIEYLNDPDAYISKDARLSERQSSFSGSMPKFHYLGADQLQLLADYLLTL